MTPRLRLAPLVFALLAAASANARLHAPDRARLGLGANTTVYYYGGPVIANPKVYAIWWGGAAQINSEVTAASGGIGAFFEGVTDSVFVDAWAQYNTDLPTQKGSKLGAAGTGQHIGRGNYAGAFDLNPVPSGNVTDAQIQSALESAITAGTLPPVDANAIYAIYFPASVTITLTGPGGGDSCAMNGFGGYHDQTTTLGAAYLVIPDCGYGFLDFTSVSSHELAEATTDLEPTPGSNPDYPQAWNDTMGDEIADLCEATGGLLSTGSGQFGVQGIWDQRSSSCQVAAHAAQDFTVAIAPHAWTLATGGSATLQVQTSTVAGAAQTLALSVQAPAGVTATLGASSLQSGGSTTLAISAPSGLRDGQVVVSAAYSSGGIVWTHTASLLLNVKSATDDFSLTLAPATQTTTVGTTVTYQVQATALTGTVPPIALGVSGLPSTAYATFAPGDIDAGTPSTLTIKTFDMAAGSYAFQVNGTGDLTRTTSGALQLNPAPVIDAGTPDAGAAAGGDVAHSGCTQAPLPALVLPLLALLALGRRSRAASRRDG